MSTVFLNETDLKQQTETVHENTKPFILSICQQSQSISWNEKLF